ncbi:GA4 desaturase [Hypoxylon sp. FL0543]|nr:GA4 desaturase [Hypoxylon sp. FL0543]
MSTITVEETSQPLDAEPALSEFGDERFLPLHGLQPLTAFSELPGRTNHAQLDARGFTGIQHATTLHESPYSSQSFMDPQLLKQHIIPDTSEMMKRVTGCTTVVAQFSMLRSSVWVPTCSIARHGEDATKESELGTVFSAIRRISPKARRGMSGTKADIISHEDSLLAAGKDLKDSYSSSGGRRWAMYSVWRPLETVERDPLASMDNRSLTDADCVPTKVQFPSLGTDIKETYPVEGLTARYSGDHKWYWIDRQTSREVLVLRLFDSDAEGRGCVAAWHGERRPSRIFGDQDFLVFIQC